MQVYWDHSNDTTVLRFSALLTRPGCNDLWTRLIEEMHRMRQEVEKLQRENGGLRRENERLRHSHNKAMHALCESGTGGTVVPQ